MPNRIIKESITNSETLDTVSAEAERLFVRLIVVCDDYGRFDARALIILGKCFPLKIGTLKDRDINRWMDELEEAGLLWRYSVGGRPYLQMTTWERHQQKRAKKSKYPQPLPDDGDSDQTPELASNCNQLIADDCNSPRKRETRNEKRETRNDSYVAFAPPAVSPVQDIWTYYLEHIQPKARSCPTEKIKTRLKEGWSADDLRTAMDRFQANYWWMLKCANKGGPWFFESKFQIDKFLLIEPQTKAEYEAEQNRGRNGRSQDAIPEPPEFVRPSND